MDGDHPMGVFINLPVLHDPDMAWATGVGRADLPGRQALAAAETGTHELILIGLSPQCLLVKPLVVILMSAVPNGIVIRVKIGHDQLGPARGVPSVVLLLELPTKVPEHDLGFLDQIADFFKGTAKDHTRARLLIYNLTTV